MSETYRPASARIIHERFDDETVIVNLDTGSYYSLPAIGSAIWALLAEGASRAGMVAVLEAHYPEAGARVAADAGAFLDELAAEALIVAEPGMGSAAPAPDLPDIYFTPRIQKYADMEEMLALDPIHDVDEVGWPVQKDGAA